MNPKNSPVTLIVVGAIASVALIYSLTLALCAVRGITPDSDLLAALKDVGLVALGALGSMLARTGHADSGAGVQNVTAETVSMPYNPQPDEPQE